MGKAYRFGDTAGYTASSVDAELTVEYDSDLEVVQIDYTGIQRGHDPGGDGSGDNTFGAPQNNLVGYYKDATSIGNMHMTWSFEMTGIDAGSRVGNADFVVTQGGTGGGTYSYDIEAHVIRTSSSSAVANSDYEDTAAEAGGALTTGLGGSGTLKHLDDAGRAALTTYLQNNWSPGDYVFIGTNKQNRKSTA